MKNVILAFGLMITTASAHAFQPSPEIVTKANLATFRTTIEAGAEQVVTLSAQVAQNEAYRKTLHFTQFAEKSQLARMNCAEIKATLGTVNMMLVSIIPIVGADVEKVPALQGPQGDIVQNGLETFSKETTIAAENCKDISLSRQHVEAAKQAYLAAQQIISAVLPKLGDK